MNDRTQQILDEFHRPGSTRQSIAAAYRAGVHECIFYNDHKFVDWPTVNAALLTRYTPSGLNYIKAIAWSRK